MRTAILTGHRPELVSRGCCDVQSDTSGEELQTEMIENFANGATAEDVLRQVQKTEKLLNKKGVRDHTISGLSRCGRNLRTGKNHSRNLYGYIQKKGKALPVPVSTVTTPIRVSRRRKMELRPWPVMHLSSWAKIVLEQYGGFFFFGGMTLNNLPDVEAMLSGFWDKYQKAEGESTEHPTRTIPYMLHGDEGRGRCKRPVLIVSFQGALGWKKDANLSMDDLLNSKKNTFTTRMLFMLLPSENYAPHGQTQQCLLDSLASDCNKLYAEGIEVTWKGETHRFYFHFLGTKGDWPWLRSAYRLYSGFTSRQICHRCDGKEWWNLGPNAEVRTWPRDRLAANPFKSGRVSSLRRIVPNGLRPDKIRIDLAHTYAICGWGKDDLASAIIFLAVHCSLFGNDVLEHKLGLAYESFVDYCKQRGKTTTIMEFSKQELKITSLRNFPRGLGKGFDAALLGAWLGSVVDNVQDGDIPECEKELFRVVQFGLRSTNKFFRLIYCGKLWLPRSVAEQVVRHGWNMLEAYQGCAQLASRKQRSLWYMRPKVHMQSHIVRDLEYQVLAGCDHCLNPACFATWSDEDFIGRIARCARKVHPIQMARNTIKRCLITYRKEWLKVMPPV